jgi:hypothetical protein
MADDAKDPAAAIERLAELTRQAMADGTYLADPFGDDEHDYRAELERLGSENARLAAENTRLRAALQVGCACLQAPCPECARLAMELTGERKAKELLSAGLESTCERYDELKHECRRLLAVAEACEVAMDTAALHGLPQQLPSAYRESWADAHTTLRTLLAGQPGAG